MIATAERTLKEAHAAAEAKLRAEYQEKMSALRTESKAAEKAATDKTKSETLGQSARDV